MTGEQLTLTPGLKPSARKVLDALRAAGRAGCTPMDLWRDCGVYRAGARVHELRRAGYPITSESLGNGVWLYRLEKA